MAFYTNMTGGTEISDALITLWEKAYLMSYFQQDVTSGIAQVHPVQGKAGIVIKYNNIAAATTPLGEYDQADANALSETQILFTPAEYGAVVSKTSLASLQSGGQVDLAAFTAVGNNAAITMNKLATAALEASSNGSNFIVGHAAVGDLAAGDVMTRAVINKAYNKLARANVPKVDGGLYVAYAHDDVIADIRNDAAAGSWVALNQYTNLTPLTNEVGTYGGFRWIRNNDATVGAGVGVGGLVDSYDTTFLGAEALLKGVSQEVGPRITGPFDNLGRFVNIGWYGVLQFKIARPESVIVVKSASSFQ